MVAIPVLGALAAAGCGEVKGRDNVNVIAGKKAFVAKCGSCHTLARAETKGVVGPDLDKAFEASIEEGLKRAPSDVPLSPDSGKLSFP